MGTGGEDSSCDTTAASQGAPERVTGSGCCKTPKKKYYPTSAATETMHRIARTVNFDEAFIKNLLTFPLDTSKVQSHSLSDC